jgi:restriction system protein
MHQVAPLDSATESVEPIETLEELAWHQQLHKMLLSLEPSAFERLAQRLLRESGFIQVQVTEKSGDGE